LLLLFLLVILEGELLLPLSFVPCKPISPLRRQDERRITKSKQATYKFTSQKLQQKHVVKRQNRESPHQIKELRVPSNYIQSAKLDIEAKRKPRHATGAFLFIASNR
jgi:hypothetical protein